MTAGKYKTPNHYADYVGRILFAVAQEVGGIYWDREYLANDLDQYSAITQYEVTVRLTREMATKLVRLDGILHRMFNLLGEQEGAKLEYSVDNTEIVGYNHQLRLDRSAASQLFPGARCGFQVKVYYPKHVRTGEPDLDDPLYYARIGVLFKKKWNNRTSYPFAEWRDLHRELEENLINILSWGGVPIEPGPTFVPDRHFQNERSEYRVGLYDDPTPEIERRQNSLLVKTFSELIDSDRDALRQLATDGGELHYQELADEVDVGTSTIYRILQRTGDILESENGVVKFISEKIRDDVLQIIKPLQEDVDAKAQAVAHLLDMNPHQLERQGSAFQQWLSKYGIEMDTLDDGTPTFKIASTVTRWTFGSGPKLIEVLRMGKRAWKDAGLDATEFNNAHIAWREPRDSGYRQGRVSATIR